MRPFLLLPLILATAPAFADKAKPKTAEPAKVEWVQDYAKAIALSQETGKLLLVFNGWEQPKVCAPCDLDKAGLALMEAEPDLSEALRRDYVCVKLFCHNVQEEEAPRGPAGPFQFQYASVPVLLIKSCEGKTLADQFGAPGDAQAVLQTLRQMLQTAARKNGPVTPPKQFAALRKELAAAHKASDRKEPAEAGRAYARLLKQLQPFESRQGDDTPEVVAEARAWIGAYEGAARDLLAEAKALEEGGDAAGAAKLYRRAADGYEALPDVAQAAREGLARLTPKKP